MLYFSLTMSNPQNTFPQELPKFCLQKVLILEDLLKELENLRQKSKTLVFTNGCFDLIHPGHIHYLYSARQLGDVLIVGVNSDCSVKKVKGSLRPIMNQNERVLILSAISSVDYITIFEEDTPLHLITSILPDILVKGGDWNTREIVGKEVVEVAGGSVISLPYYKGLSSTAIFERILSRYGD